MQNVEQDITDMKQSLGELRVQTLEMFDFMKETRKEMVTIKENMATKNDLAEVLEIVNFIKDTAVTREELFDVKSNLKNDFVGLNRRLTRVESLMVTKDYLDDKLADFRSDIMSFVNRKFAHI